MTDEQIDQAMNAFKVLYLIEKKLTVFDDEGRQLIKQINELAALACIGAAVKPRPISEAPKDGTKILLMGNGPKFWATEGAWIEWAAQWRDTTSFKYELVLPHSWIPLDALSALPPPEGQEPK